MKNYKRIILCLSLVVGLISFQSCGDDDDGGSNNPSPVTFSKADGADWTLEANQDRITDNVWITRANNGFIFNIAQEDAFSGGCASTLPSDTEWAIGSYSDGVDNLTFGALLDPALFDCTPPDMVNVDLVLHLISDDRYYDVTFTSWSIGDNGGQGGFSYTRTRRD